MRGLLLLLLLGFPAPAAAQQGSPTGSVSSCPYEAQVCAARQAVFAISGFSPVASAVRLGPDLLVTARHAVAGGEVELFLADGTVLPAEVVPSGLPLDLNLLRVDGLPAGPSLALAATASEPLHVVGADVASARIAVFAPGAILARPPAELPLARLHHGAHTQPGNSGGALIDGDGRLVGIAVAGGDGRYEAIPVAALERLRAASGAGQATADAAFAEAVRDCTLGLEALGEREVPAGAAAEALAGRCLASGNRQFYDLAGQAFGRAGQLDAAARLFEASLEQDPQALNTRLSLAITLHVAKRWEQALPHLRRLMERLPGDPQVLRLAVQAGKLGGDAALAERAYREIAERFPAQAPAARAFLDSTAPPPER